MHAMRRVIDLRVVAHKYLLTTYADMLIKARSGREVVFDGYQDEISGNFACDFRLYELTQTQAGRICYFELCYI